MSTLIAYATKHGCTEACAKQLSTKLTGKVDLCNLKERQLPDLKQYEKVIIGGSVYIGKMRKEANDFCLQHLHELKGKKVGLFICGMREGDTAKEEINTSFPEELLNNAVVKECFGGEFIFSKMNFIESFIVKKVAKTDKDVSNIQIENINRFARAMNNA